MKLGIETSEKLFHEVIEPIINSTFPTLNYSASLVGEGSEVLGFDDFLSTDHNYSPRVSLFVSQNDYDRFADKIINAIRESATVEFQGYKLPYDDFRKYIEIHSLESYFVNYLDIESPPQSNIEWLKLNEQKLVEVTSGKIFNDPQKQFKNAQSIYSFYPSDVRIYNIYLCYLRLSEIGGIYRSLIRKDDLLTNIYVSYFTYFAIKLFHLYKKRYCPYLKWMNKSMQRQGNDGKELATMLTDLIQSQEKKELILKILSSLTSPILNELNIEDDNFVINHELNLLEFNWDLVLKNIKPMLHNDFLNHKGVISSEPYWGIIFDHEGLGYNFKELLNIHMELYQTGL